MGHETRRVHDVIPVLQSERNAASNNKSDKGETMNICLSDGRAGKLLLCSSALCMSLAFTTPTLAQSSNTADLEEVIVTGSRIVRRDDSSDSPLLTVTTENLTSTTAISIDQTLGKLPQFAPGSNQFTDSGSTQATPTSSPGIATANLRGLGANRTLVLVDGRRMQPANASLTVDLNTIPTLAIDSVEIITGGAGSTYGADAVAGVVNFKLKNNFEGLSFDGRYGMTQEGDGEEYRISTLMGTNFQDDRGNVMIGLSYAKRRPSYERKHDFFANALTDPDTPGGSRPYYPAFQGTAGSQAVIDSVFPGQPAGDVSSRTSAFYFIPGATTQDASIFVPTAGLVSGDPAVGFTDPIAPMHKLSSKGALQTVAPEAYLSLPLESYSAFLRGHFDVTDNIEFYIQGNFDHKELTTRSGTYQIGFNQWSVSVPRDADHPVPDALTALLDSRTSAVDGQGHPVTGADAAAAPWTLQNPVQQLGIGGVSLHNTTDTYQMLAGFRGDLGVKDWTYDVFISHGDTNQIATYDGYVDIEAYQALINLPNYGANTDFSNGRLGRNASCTSGINPFIDSPVSQDCIDILHPQISTGTGITQDMAELNFQGGMFELPAGEVRFAVGGAWRSNKFDYTPSKGIATTNITGFTIGLFDTTETHGKVSAKEIYGELLIPVLHDLPMVQSFDLNAGIRYSDYNTVGGVTTWKTTGDWSVNDFLKFRGGYQVANRAPNVAELFQPPVFTIVGWPDDDPCSTNTRGSYGNVPGNPDRAQVQALCTALNGGNVQIDENYVGNNPVYFGVGRDLTQGNPDLKSEKAKTWTFGTVIESPFESEALRDMHLSLDYYRINITGAISPASTQLVYQECFNSLGNNPTYDVNNEYCQRILRDPVTGYWLATVAQFQNLGKIQTSGVDVAFNWGHEAPGIDGNTGRVSLNVLFNYVDSYKVQNNPGGPTFDYAGSIQATTASPPYGAVFRWKLNTTLGYDFGPAAVNLNWRHLPGQKHAAKVTNPNAGQSDISSSNVFDLTGRWMVSDNFTLRAGIENLLNADPEVVGVLPGVTNAAGTTTSDYDQLGRRFFLGIGADF